jgi:serine/threonine-protein kinase RsbW
MSEDSTQDPHGRPPGEAMMPDIELALDARAENIAIVRHALGGFGEAYEVPEEKLSDIRLAVTEACANVVVHAYPDGQEGRMEVVAKMEEETLTVLVRDWGRGIRPRPDSPGLGLGLSLIAALAESVQLGHDNQEHTEVRMTFALHDRVSSTSPARLEYPVGQHPIEHRRAPGHEHPAGQHPNGHEHSNGHEHPSGHEHALGHEQTRGAMSSTKGLPAARISRRAQVDKAREQGDG